MVAKITHPKAIYRAIYYNEHKVSDRAAVLLLAQNFLKDTEQLNLVEKKERFGQLIALNQKVERNTLHVSLNFAPGEQFSKEQLLEIAQEYMERIGFGDQPYLVYEHLDAGHPHLHSVSTNIRDDGTRIDMNFIGRDKSEPARKAIEEKYKLIKAEGQKHSAKEREPLEQKIEYGKKDTKRAIVNALDYIFRQYGFRSLAELNAVLRLYNLKADRGQPGSRIYQHRGLVYQVLDEKGQGIGVPIKASALWFKPGLDFLEEQFKKHQKINPEEITHVRSILEAAIRAKPANVEGLFVLLRKEKIEAIPYIDKDGKLYGLSFVDLEGKQVLKASDLGKEYSSRKILARLGLDPFLRPLRTPEDRKGKKTTRDIPAATHSTSNSMHETKDPGVIDKTLDILFRSEENGDRLPYELRKDKKKKKRK